MNSKMTIQQIQNAINSLPQNWQLLNHTDLEEYLKLRLQNEEDTTKSKKGERIDTFNNRLDQIRKYIERDLENQWKRSLICGVIFLHDGVAIHIQNFKMLLARCKSSINGSFQQMGYAAIQCNPSAAQEIVQKIPYFAKYPGELKKWTFREFKNEQNHPQIEKKKPFIIELPKKKMSNFDLPVKVVNQEEHKLGEPEKKPLVAEEVQKAVTRAFPCPVKYRYKFYDAIYQSVSIQTEA
ncbi:hypothetical protein TRFO_42883 [Tritrichomonas foetus]|uniref:Initiator binding domain-containing protein n=1 Tax=Tritrichomonas foetus TaxID=1144522 RepID=A0A1J4KV81_9EUKA|nr:hypothetical protein TRFO_42883 [Tritrichomonas foetus]|eukprot:OHT14800.1 hypothetical protein TRFO_42883 [Tritrichomonas foetus]